MLLCVGRLVLPYRVVIGAGAGSVVVVAVVSPVLCVIAGAVSVESSWVDSVSLLG